MTKNVFYNKKSEAVICDIYEHFGFPILKFNLVSSQLLANLVQSKNQAKAILWLCHLCLEHGRSEIIDQLKKHDNLKINKNNNTAPKTVQCTTCVVLKMHQLINWKSTEKTMKLYQMLHFNLTILNKEFDETNCIVHFTDKFTSYSWVFSFINHKKKNINACVKNLINKCNCAGLSINSDVFIIRSGQKISIDDNLKEWVKNQKIDWNWSAKNTSDQNGTFEQYDVLLTEKARYICFHAKFSKDLYLECYLATVYLINRTLNKSLKWASLLVALQKHIEQSIKHQIV